MQVRDVKSRAKNRSGTLSRFLRHRLAVVGGAMLVFMIAAVVFGPVLLQQNYILIDIRSRFLPPLSGIHLLGTDELGRDVASRILMAGRISMSIGVAVMVIATAVGTIVGMIAGFYQGLIGSVLMRFVDAVLCFPPIFLLLAIASFIHPNAITLTLIIAATCWMEVARIVESRVRSFRERDFVVAAEMLGASDRIILFRELLPNMVGPIAVAATLTVARAILMEAYVSFLGFGIQPPDASWGNMLNGAQAYLISAPWLAFAPGVAIILAVASVNFLGDGLRDSFDARTRA
ncbi:ABC transporter permease [Agrobacterium tumefaciens]|uniref:ABC transporter permease n=1 Tax=Agrobacterium tumefaciens TaxID=358 RepID=UPI003C6C7258